MRKHVLASSRSITRQAAHAVISEALLSAGRWARAGPWGRMTTRTQRRTTKLQMSPTQSEGLATVAGRAAGRPPAHAMRPPGAPCSQPPVSQTHTLPCQGWQETAQGRGARGSLYPWEDHRRGRWVPLWVPAQRSRPAAAAAHYIAAQPGWPQPRPAPTTAPTDPDARSRPACLPGLACRPAGPPAAAPAAASSGQPPQPTQLPLPPAAYSKVKLATERETGTKYACKVIGRALPRASSAAARPAAGARRQGRGRPAAVPTAVGSRSSAAAAAGPCRGLPATYISRPSCDWSWSPCSDGWGLPWAPPSPPCTQIIQLPKPRDEDLEYGHTRGGCRGGVHDFFFFLSFRAPSLLSPLSLLPLPIHWVGLGWVRLPGPHHGPSPRP